MEKGRPGLSSELERQLRRSLRLRAGTTDILYNREGTTIEFKTSFNLGSIGQYARTMIAFSNNCGGHILFGVEPSPHRLVGVNPRFKTADPATITSFLRDHVVPVPEWELGEFVFHDVELGYLYTHEARSKPLIVALEFPWFGGQLESRIPDPRRRER